MFLLPVFLSLFLLSLSEKLNQEKTIQDENERDKRGDKRQRETREEAVEIYQRGLSLYDLNQKEEALIYFDQALELDPNYADAYVMQRRSERMS